MKPIIETYLSLAIGMADCMDVNSEEWKKEILDEWEKSKNYPRKKKKRIRKELTLDWSIASYDPFNIKF